LQLAQPDLDNITVHRRRFSILRKYRYLCRLIVSLLEDLDRATPSRSLAVVDLPEIQDLALHDAALLATPILDDTPITVLFPILETLVGAQKHGRSF
jgi:hypothetical protein